MNLLGVPWWRKEPLTPPEMRLLQAVAEAHAASAQRNNCSSVAVLNAAAGAQDFGQAMAAGLLTMGGLHAPIRATCQLLADAEPGVRAFALLQRGAKVPGWGNSFHLGEPDPLWVKVDAELRAGFPEIHRKLAAVTATLHLARRCLYPNPSAYTAAAALAVHLPAKCAAYLFIAARLDSWAQLIASNIHE